MIYLFYIYFALADSTHVGLCFQWLITKTQFHLFRIAITSVWKKIDLNSHDPWNLNDGPWWFQSLSISYIYLILYFHILQPVRNHNMATPLWHFWLRRLSVAPRFLLSLLFPSPWWGKEHYLLPAHYAKLFLFLLSAKKYIHE